MWRCCWIGCRGDCSAHASGRTIDRWKTSTTWRGETFEDDERLIAFDSSSDDCTADHHHRRRSERSSPTTFARAFPPREAECPRFINADLIAAGLSPFEPEAMAIRAARVMLEEIDAAVGRGESFAFETTLAGRGYVRRIRGWRAKGYHVTLIFISLPGAEWAVKWVAERVRQGGHDIAEHVVRRRFLSGRKNFEERYKRIVDDWVLYDNSGLEPLLIEWRERGWKRQFAMAIIWFTPVIQTSAIRSQPCSAPLAWPARSPFARGRTSSSVGMARWFASRAKS